MYNLKNNSMKISFEVAQRFGANCETVGFFIRPGSLKYDYCGRESNLQHVDAGQPCYSMGDGKHYMIPIQDAHDGHFYSEFVWDDEPSKTTTRRVVFCNFPYVSGYGAFRHTEISLSEAEHLVSECGDNWLSAIGHESTAQLLSELFGKQIPVNRIDYQYQTGDIQLIFRLKKRQPEGSILNRETLDKVGYSFSIIEAVI